MDRKPMLLANADPFTGEVILICMTKQRLNP